jgi:hypothetical protein
VENSMGRKVKGFMLELEFDSVEEWLDVEGRWM